MEELLAKAHEIADWYEEKDILFDDDDCPYVNTELEDDEGNVEVKRRYL